METTNQDAIDVMVEQWAEQRPDLDLGPMAVQIELTAEGRTLVDDAVAARVAYEAKLLAGLGPTNQRRLAVLLRKLLLTLADDRR